MNSILHKILCFALLLIAEYGYSQIYKDDKGYIVPALVIEKDTFAYIHLPKVYSFPPLKFSNKKELDQYRRLVKNVKKAYPYAQLAKKTLREIEEGAAKLPEGKQRKKFIKQKEDELLKTYSKELKALTITQGRILLKLVDRELNKSSYEIIKDLRGSFSAFMYQGIASLFGETLKQSYNALGEDALIERIVILIEQGMI